RGGEPGTLYVIEAEPGEQTEPLDAHGMRPDAVLRILRLLGGKAGRVLVVGCEPESVAEGIGLSPVVAAALPGAIDLVIQLARGRRITSIPVRGKEGHAMLKGLL